MRKLHYINLLYEKIVAEMHLNRSVTVHLARSTDAREGRGVEK